MATTPTFVNIPADTWTLVANAVTDGVVHIKIPNSRHGYMHYYKVDGEAAPTATDDTLGIPFDGESAIISSDAAIDVYIFCRYQAGRVRVDL
jgi:hypothetical protein